MDECECQCRPIIIIAYYVNCVVFSQGPAGGTNTTASPSSAGAGTTGVVSPVFRTPMTFSPRVAGEVARPSPSKFEVWKQQLGLDGEKNELK